MLDRRFPIGILVLLATSATSIARAQTYYSTSSGASDAQRIQNEMLNDAASGRFRSQGFAPAHNAFDDYIAQRAADEEARLAEMYRYSERIAEEYEARERWEREQAWALERARQENLERIARDDQNAARQALQDEQTADLRTYSRTRDPEKRLEGAWKSELGHFDRVDRTREMARSFELESFLDAAREGEALGFIGAASMQSNDAPRFTNIMVDVLNRESVLARLERLQELTANGNVGATLWLAGWITGRNVGLGTPLVTIPGSESPRSVAFACLRSVAEKYPSEGLPWLVHELSVDHARSSAPARSNEFESALRALDAACDSASALQEFGQFEWSLAQVERLGASAVLRLAQATGVEKQSNGSVSKPMPIAAAMLGRLWLEGRCGGFEPGRAAEAFEQLPNNNRWVYDRALGDLARAYALEFGTDQDARKRGVVSAFAAAVNGFARARKSTAAEGALEVPATATVDERDAKLWLLASRVRFSSKEETRETARAALDKLVEYGDPWARVMRALAILERKEVGSDERKIAVHDMHVVGLFGREHSASRVLAATRCTMKIDSSYGLLGLEECSARVAEMKPSDALTIGGGELACAYFSPLQARDVERREGAPWVFEAFVKAGRAGGHPTMWVRAAALAEVLQKQLLSPEEWDRRWLSAFAECAADEEQPPFNRKTAATLRDLLREPTVDKIEALEAAPYDFIGTGEAEDGFATLLASLRVRLAATTEEAEDAAMRLKGQADAGRWHAQALLTDFDAHYRESYMARDDAAGFHRDAARAFEGIAIYCSAGIGFVAKDAAHKTHAMLSAIRHGGTMFARVHFEELAGDAPQAVATALVVLERMQASALSPLELDEIEQTSRLLSKQCVESGKQPGDVPTRERLRMVASAIGRERGAEAALRYVDQQREKLPYVDWELGDLYEQDFTTFPGGCARSMVAYERAARDGMSVPTRQQVLTWIDCAGRVGDAGELERVTQFVLAPTTLRMFDATGSATQFGNGLVDLADGWERLAKAITDAGSSAECTTTARELRFVGLQLGSQRAFDALKNADITNIDELERIGRALLDCSTMNAPEALDWLGRASALRSTRGDNTTLYWLGSDLGKWRLDTIQKKRESDFGADAASKLVYDKNDRANALERQHLLYLARVHGALQAIEILSTSYAVPAAVVEEKPKIWAMILSSAGYRTNSAEILAKMPLIDAMIAECEAVYGADSKERAEFQTAIESAAVCLANCETPPEGVEPETFARAQAELIERALDEGALNVFVYLLDRSTKSGDAALMDLARKILARDTFNAVLLEETLRPRLDDTSAFDSLFVEHDLFASGTTQRTPLFEFVRARRAQALVFGRDIPKPYMLPKLFSRNPHWRHGWVGEALSRERNSDDAITLRVFASIGVDPQDVDELKIERN